MVTDCRNAVGRVGAGHLTCEREDLEGHNVCLSL